MIAPSCDLVRGGVGWGGHLGAEMRFLIVGQLPEDWTRRLMKVGPLRPVDYISALSGMAGHGTAVVVQHPSINHPRLGVL